MTLMMQGTHRIMGRSPAPSVSGQSEGHAQSGDPHAAARSQRLVVHVRIVCKDDKPSLAAASKAYD